LSTCPHDSCVRGLLPCHRAVLPTPSPGSLTITCRPKHILFPLIFDRDASGLFALSSRDPTSPPVPTGSPWAGLSPEPVKAATAWSGNSQGIQCRCLRTGPHPSRACLHIPPSQNADAKRHRSLLRAGLSPGHTVAEPRLAPNLIRHSTLISGCTCAVAAYQPFTALHHHPYARLHVGGSSLQTKRGQTTPLSRLRGSHIPSHRLGCRTPFDYRNAHHVRSRPCRAGRPVFTTGQFIANSHGDLLRHPGMCVPYAKVASPWSCAHAVPPRAVATYAQGVCQCSVGDPASMLAGMGAGHICAG